MKATIRLSARATPGTLRARSTTVSGKGRAKSTFGVLCEVIHRSAFACWMVTVDLSSRPMNKPTCTSTRVPAKATPATVITKRSRSWNRFLRASETMALALRRIGQEAADAVLDHLKGEIGGGGGRRGPAGGGGGRGAAGLRGPSSQGSGAAGGGPSWGRRPAATARCTA